MSRRWNLSIALVDDRGGGGGGADRDSIQKLWRLCHLHPTLRAALLRKTGSMVVVICDGALVNRSERGLQQQQQQHYEVVRGVSRSLLIVLALLLINEEEVMDLFHTESAGE